MASVVIERIEADVVDHRADLREQRADLGLVLPELRERMLRPEADQLLALQLRELLPFREALRHRLAVHLGQLAAWDRTSPGATARRPW